MTAKYCAVLRALEHQALELLSTAWSSSKLEFSDEVTLISLPTTESVSRAPHPGPLVVDPKIIMFKNSHTIHEINRSINQSINKSINQSINQSTDRSTDRPIDQSINKSINQSSNQSINWSISQSNSLYSKWVTLNSYKINELVAILKKAK